MTNKIDAVDDFDHEAVCFDDWFHANEDLCHEMLRSDPYELLFAAWFGGLSHGLNTAHTFRPALVKPSASPKKIDDDTDPKVD